MLGTIFDKKTASKNKLLRLNYYAVFNKFGLKHKNRIKIHRKMYDRFW